MSDEAHLKKLQAPTNFEGPTKDRKCTDVLFSLLLVLAWVAMTIIGVMSIEDGDIDLLISPVDYNGNLCGYTSGYTETSQLYYANIYGSGICVDGCPSTTDTSVLYACVDDYPTSYTDTMLVAAGYCMWQYESTDVLNYCIIDNSTVWDAFTSTDEAKYLTQFASDIYTADAYIFGFGFVVAVLLGFVWIYLMRVPGLVSLLVWICIWMVLASFAALGYALYDKAVEWDNDSPATHEDYEVYAAYVLAYIFYALAAVWLLLMCYMRKRIELAVGVIKEASRAVASMPLLVFLPFLQLAGMVLFLVPWVIYMLYTATLGDYDINYYTTDAGITLSYKTFSYSDQVYYRGWFLLFVMFWSLAFITAMGQIVNAMAVATWYFTREKKNIGSGVVITSARRSMWYHTGTAAFGSLIIAVIQMIETALSYLQSKAKATGNKVAEAVLCCCICCFWCLEKCMKFINKNAYVQTAIFSTNFCGSAKKAFWLIARNVARIGAVSLLSDFILILMQLFVCLVSGALAYWLMATQIDSELNSLVGPTVMVMILAYFTSSMFTAVYGMSITTVLQCFIADEEMFLPANRFAEHDLRDWVNKNGGHGETAMPLITTDAKDAANKSGQATTGTGPNGVYRKP